MNSKSKCLSLLLSVCLLFSLFAGYAPAASAVSADNADAALPVTAPVLSQAQLPDIIAPEEAQSNRYTQRLAAQEPDLNTLLFRNADGTETMRVFSHPVKYLSENGEVKDISLSMLRAADGSVQAASSPIETVFSKQLSGGISLAYKDVQIRMTPQSPVSDGLHAQKLSLASLSADGKTVSYPYGAHTSLEYSLTYAGFKEDIVVEQYTGQTEYSFLLSTGGLLLTEHNGSYFLADEKGEIKASIGDIIVFTADERNNTLGSMAAETVKEGEAYLLTIRLDADYLQDEKTVYPIRIDPTIEITYSGSGAGAIEDVTIIQKGYYYGTAGSLMVGRYETNGLCRVLMRFPNLSLSGTITAATVELRDLMCQGDEDITVDCHIYKNTAPAWSEAVQATWSTVGTAYLGTKLDSKLISYGKGNVSGQSHRYAFNILAAAREWANGTQSPAKGLVFKASDSFESQTGSAVKNWHKTFASYNRASNQPSLSVTYQPPQTIIPNGVYRIKNNYSGLYLHSADRVNNLTNVYQYEKQTTEPSSLSQLWKISYLGNNRYSIRPMHKLDMGLANFNNNACIYSIGATDSGSNLLLSARWIIDAMDNGIVGIYPDSGSLSALSLVSDTTASSANVVIASNTGAARQKWALELVSSPPSGVRWYDNLGNPISGSTGNPKDASIEKYMVVGETKTLSELKLLPASYSGTNINQTFEWSVYDMDNYAVDTGRVATINASTGEITAVAPGYSIIRGRKVLNSQEYWVTFVLHVSTDAEADWPDAFIRNAESIKYVDIENQTMANNTAIHQWQFHGGKTQRWKLERDVDGYYTIRSLNSGSTSYYLGIAGTSVILTSSGSLNSSKWKIGFGGKKGVKLIPKTRESEDYVLALQTSNTNNGTKLVIQPHTYDDDFSDEWMLPGKVDYSLVYIGVSDGDANMPPYITLNENAFHASGRYGNGVTAAEKHEMLEYLALSNVFSCITHGNVTCIQLTNGVTLDTTDIAPLASDAFADLDIVCLGACYTGMGRENAANLVNAIHSKGAKIVIGFTTEVIVSETERWVAGFTTAIAQGKTVEEAITAGDNAAKEERDRNGKATTTEAYRYVVGDTNFIPCP